MNTETLTANSAEYNSLPSEAKNILEVLKNSSVLSLSPEAGDVFYLKKTFRASYDFAVERTLDGMTFTLLTFTIVKKRSRAIQADVLNVDFPGLSNNPTPALTAIFGTGVQKKKNMGSVHAQSYGISKLRAQQITDQAASLVKRTPKLPDSQFINLVSLLYCSHEDSLVSKASVKPIAERSVLESLKFLLLNLDAAKIIRLWSRKISAEEYRAFGKSLEDTPDRWLDVLFGDEDEV